MENVQVEIFGQSYSLKGKDNAAYIRELASFIDAKMKEVQKATGTADPHRVAILAALTISDELYRLRREHASLAQTVEKKISQLLEISDPVEEPR
jgi:cell division protein ZapA (FtsZ GTPase activity inhibitor)